MNRPVKNMRTIGGVAPGVGKRNKPNKTKKKRGRKKTKDVYGLANMFAEAERSYTKKGGKRSSKAIREYLTPEQKKTRRRARYEKTRLDRCWELLTSKGYKVSMPGGTGAKITV